MTVWRPGCRLSGLQLGVATKNEPCFMRRTCAVTGRVEESRILRHRRDPGENRAARVFWQSVGPGRSCIRDAREVDVFTLGRGQGPKPR